MTLQCTTKHVTYIGVPITRESNGKEVYLFFFFGGNRRSHLFWDPHTTNFLGVTDTPIWISGTWTASNLSIRSPHALPIELSRAAGRSQSKTYAVARLLGITLHYTLHTHITTPPYALTFLHDYNISMTIQSGRGGTVISLISRVKYFQFEVQYRKPEKSETEGTLILPNGPWSNKKNDDNKYKRRNSQIMDHGSRLHFTAISFLQGSTFWSRYKPTVSSCREGIHRNICIYLQS